MSFTLEYLRKIGRVKRTACIMLQDRMYDLPEIEGSLISSTDLAVGSHYVNAAIGANCSLARAMSSVYVSKQAPKILVYFLDLNYDDAKRREKMVSCDQTKAAIILWKTTFSDCTLCILISPGKLSPDAKKEVTIQNLTVLTHDFLMFPVGRHVMVPNHMKLLENEKERFLQERKLEAYQLPNLKLSDPITMYYGYNIGDIIRVQRPGWDVFRVVVS